MAKHRLKRQRPLWVARVMVGTLVALGGGVAALNVTIAPPVEVAQAATVTPSTPPVAFTAPVTPMVEPPVLTPAPVVASQPVRKKRKACQ